MTAHLVSRLAQSCCTLLHNITSAEKQADGSGTPHPPRRGGVQRTAATYDEG
ncbi:MAG: hypothetical protein ABIT07_01305 [Ferruginibacter sp.]